MSSAQRWQRRRRWLLADDQGRPLAELVEDRATGTGSRGDGTVAQTAAEQEDRERGAGEIRTGLDRLPERAAQIDASLLTVPQEAAPSGPGLPRPLGAVHDVAAGPVRAWGSEYISPFPTSFPDREPPSPTAPTPRPVTTPPAALISGVAPAAAPTTAPPAPAAGATAGMVAGTALARADALVRADAAATAAFDPARLLGDGYALPLAASGALPAVTDEAGTVVVQPPDPWPGA